MVTDLASGWPVMLRVGQDMTARLTADRAAGVAAGRFVPVRRDGVVALARANRPTKRPRVRPASKCFA